MYRVVLLALLLQLNYIHLILKSDPSFIAYIVLLDYPAQLDFLPFILSDPYSRHRAQQKLQDTLTLSLGLLQARSASSLAYSVSAGLEGPRVCLGLVCGLP